MTTRRDDELPFFVEAFRHPYNLIGLGTAAGFALLSWSLLPLVLASGLELLLLPLIAALPRFQDLVRARRSVARLAQAQSTSQSLNASLVAALPDPERRRYDSLERVAAEIRANYRGLDRSSRTLLQELDVKLDSLLGVYLRMRGALLRYDSYFAGVDEKRLRERLGALGRESAERPASVRPVKERTRGVLEKRLERHRQAVESRQLVEAQAESVLEVLQFLRDQSYSLSDPRSIAEQLDGLVSAAEITERGVRDLESVFDDVYGTSAFSSGATHRSAGTSYNTKSLSNCQ